jgi:hypothetical protein
MRQFVRETLSQTEQLEAAAFPFTERVLVRRRRPCGMYFCLHGPRSVKLSAVWDALTNMLLFYNATGERYLTTKVIQAPALA